MPSYKRTLELDYDEKRTAAVPASARPMSSRAYEYCNTSDIHPNTSRERLVKNPPFIPGKYNWDEGERQGHQHKRVRHSNPHKEEMADLASHHYRPPHQPLSGSRSPPSKGPKLPKNFSTPLTCYYWYNGTCSKDAADCIYAHHYAGLVAEPPVKIGSAGVGVAGPDAAKAVGDALELRKALHEKEQKLREREDAVKKREERVKEVAGELKEWERRINKDSDRVRKREDDLLDRETDLFKRERLEREGKGV